MDVIQYFVIPIATFVIGVIFGQFVQNKNSVGDIIVTRDEDGTYLSLNIDKLEDITSATSVTLNVRENN